MAEQELPKLTTRVRFPSPAPSIQERFCYRGDIVQVKSGGPEMFVVALEGECIVCEWVECDVIIERETFKAEDLVLMRRA